MYKTPKDSVNHRHGIRIAPLLYVYVLASLQKWYPNTTKGTQPSESTCTGSVSWMSRLEIELPNSARYSISGAHPAYWPGILWVYEKELLLNAASEAIAVRSPDSRCRPNCYVYRVWLKFNSEAAWSRLLAAEASSRNLGMKLMPPNVLLYLAGASSLVLCLYSLPLTSL